MNPPVRHARGKGWRKDIEREDVRRFGAVFRDGPPQILSFPDQRAFRGPRLYQGAVQSCFAFSLVRAFQLRHAIAIWNSQEPVRNVSDASARFLYWIGRRAVYAGQDPTVHGTRDEGLYPSVAMDAVQQHGVCREELCPYDLGDLSWVNRQPPPMAFQHAYDQAGFEYYRIEESGPARVTRVAQALCAGFAVVRGMMIDSAYERYDGLAARSPGLAALMTVFLLSLAGIPPTVGFIAKLTVFGAAIRAGNWPLVLVCVLASVVAAYAYLRVIVRMYFRRPAEDVEDDRSLFPQAVGIVLAAAVLVLGVFPRLLSSIIERASILRW